MTNNAPQAAPADIENERRAMVVTLVRLAIPMWRAQRRLQKDGGDGPSVYAALKHLERAAETLRGVGIESKDYVGQGYDPGMSIFITPVTFQHDAGCASETVIETMSPAVFYRGQIVAKSEVVIGVPIATSPQAQQTPVAPAPPNEPPTREVPPVVGPEPEASSGAAPTAATPVPEALASQPSPPDVPPAAVPTEAESATAAAVMPQLNDADGPPAASPNQPKPPVPKAAE